jgi:2-dehydro-3-deoxyphosphooctonate aldolase (KDO 8-P synthase)
MIPNIHNIKYNSFGNFFLLAGPCVVESEKNVYEIAQHLIKITDKLQIPYIFKASFKKANRSRVDSFTGIGDEKALNILGKIRKDFGVPVVTDVHTEEDAQRAAEFVDVLQIPAFLSRQTELLIAAAKTGKVINIKKGQFMSAESMQFACQKVIDSGNSSIMLTDRGTMFGYNDLIVDFRSVPIMQKTGFSVVVDITHSLQQPNQSSGITGGQPEMIETMGRAAIAVGADGIFMETHPNPAQAKSDGANMLKLEYAEKLLTNLHAIRQTVNALKK